MSTIVRPIQDGAVVGRRFRWPSQKHLTPSHCVCGARLLADEFPTAEHPNVDVSCLLCARVACTLAWGDPPEPMTPEQFAALPSTQRRPSKPWPVAPDGNLAARVVRLLERGTPLDVEALADELGHQVQVIRNAMSEARRGGHNIVCRGGRYKLESHR